ncbi:unnamed protein product [Haemonchus placei]|uniref:Focal_AT domain-containing protein n=1 Tax=Haemonchus placei TaxID=6290 RepID=A0A0N4WMP4_HAEPC|nr:unnamed protein product [Haemonchus placei]
MAGKRPLQNSKTVSQKSRKVAGVALDQSIQCETIDYRYCSVSDLLDAMLERNTNPVVRAMIHALQDKIVHTISNTIEEDRKSRSIVVAGLAEEPRELPASRRQSELEGKITGILDILDVECRPQTVPDGYV